MRDVHDADLDRSTVGRTKHTASCITTHTDEQADTPPSLLQTALPHRSHRLVALSRDATFLLTYS